jgi:hypothetical protein
MKCRICSSRNASCLHLSSNSGHEDIWLKECTNTVTDPHNVKLSAEIIRQNGTLSVSMIKFIYVSAGFFYKAI